MAKAKQIFTALWYPWYVDAVLTSESVDHLSLAEEGAYRRLLDKSWKNGSVPADPKKCANVIGKNCTPKIAEAVLTMFQPVPGDPSRVINSKLEKVRKEQERKYKTKSRIGKENVAKRWKKKTSGDSNGIATEYHKDTDTDSSKEEFKEVSVGRPLREIYIGTVTAELAKRMDLKTLPSKLEWQREAEWSAHNGFTADQFLETYDLLKQQKWRDGPVKPKHVTEHLPQLAKLRKEIEKQKNGTSQQHQRPHRETTRDRLAATAASLSKYPTEAELAELREDGGNANRSG